MYLLDSACLYLTVWEGVEEREEEEEKEEEEPHETGRELQLSLTIWASG
jgi:hypothetical protein